MDRAVIEGDPHTLIEGMLIGAYAMGSDEGVVYVRAEYPLAIQRLNNHLPFPRKKKEVIWGEHTGFQIQF